MTTSAWFLHLNKCKYDFAQTDSVSFRPVKDLPPSSKTSTPNSPIGVTRFFQNSTHDKFGAQTEPEKDYTHWSTFIHFEKRTMPPFPTFWLSLKIFPVSELVR